MDRIQPAEVHGLQCTEAFGENSESFHQLKSVAERRRNEKIKPLVIEIESLRRNYKEKDEYAGVKTPEMDVKSRSEPPSIPPSPPAATKVPQIVISQHIDLFPFATFEYLSEITTFVMSRTGSASAKISTTSDLGLFNCDFPQSPYWEGCKPEAVEKIMTIYDLSNSKLVMQLHYVMPPCHSCFEEDSNRIEIFGPDERLMATILQKKTWIASRVDREILIEPGPYGKSNTYTTTFNWNDASINFKANRSGIVVATLMTDCVEKGHESDYVLQFLREICPRDKAMLVAFTLARDTLVSDESRTRQTVERITMFLFLIVFIAVCTYMFHPGKNASQQP